MESLSLTIATRDVQARIRQRLLGLGTRARSRCRAFLSGGEWAGEIGTATNTVGLKASRTPADSRQLDYPNAVIAWAEIALPPAPPAAELPATRVRLTEGWVRMYRPKL